MNLYHNVIFQEWVLPSEAFHPRHEILDRDTPLESYPHGGADGAQTQLTLENELSNSVVTNTNVDQSSNKILTTDMRLVQYPDWQFMNIVTDMLKNFAAEVHLVCFSISVGEIKSDCMVKPQYYDQII